MTDTRPEAVESVAEAAWRSHREFNWKPADSWDQLSQEKQDHWQYVADGVLSTLPTSPTVDEAEIQDIIREAFDTHIDVGTWARRGEFVFAAAQEIAARLRGENRG